MRLNSCAGAYRGRAHRERSSPQLQAVELFAAQAPAHIPCSAKGCCNSLTSPQPHLKYSNSTFVPQT